MSYDTKVTVVLSSAIPVGIGSSGTVAANGALTLTTALTIVYPNIFLFFPAGAVYANSPAGFYLCQMTSTTLGTIFNNLYTTGPATVPAVLNSIVAAGPGAYTQILTAQAALSFTLPGGIIGNNGSLTYDAQWSYANNGNTKTFAITWPGGNIFGSTATTTASLLVSRSIYNRGPSSQVTGGNGQLGPGAAAGTVQQFSADTSVGVLTTVTVQLAVATDFIVLEACRIIANFT